MATVTLKTCTNHPYWTVDEEALKLAHHCQKCDEDEKLCCTVGSLECPFQKYCSEIMASDWINIITL